jgi:STE24 endopeptidase
MAPNTLTLAFALALVASLLVRWWLISRQVRHVFAHRNAVPEPFAQTVALEAHRKAADYTIARNRFELVAVAAGTAVLLGWTLLGGLHTLNVALLDALHPRLGDLGYQLALLGAVTLIGALLDLPLELWRTFRIEQRFGFNRTTWRLWARDQALSAVLTLAIGTPLAAVVLWLMAAAGPWWWLWAFGVLAAFMLLAQVLVPTVIAPLFNKFEPLADEPLRQRVESLMQRCGFRAKGFFVMDGSRRSAHANAYFTGFGASKRVVFFDTLLAKLDAGEVEAVVAHELGHFRHRHVFKRIVTMFAIFFAVLALLGWLVNQPAFYLGLGVAPNAAAPNHALALILIMMAGPVFLFFASPLFAALSRRQEFEADAFACQQSDGRRLADALLKLYQDNASTLTPDPLYVRFHYSHPPAAERLAAMLQRPVAA